MSALSEQEIIDIEAQIKSKGDFIRQLKADGVDKPTLAPHVEELLALPCSGTVPDTTPQSSSAVL